MKEYYLRDHEITRYTVEQLLNNLFYEIRELLNTPGLTEEQIDKLSSALDGTLNGEYGVMLLSSDLMGYSYKLVTDPKTGETHYEKKDAADPADIYQSMNILIQEINHVLNNDITL